VSDGTDCAWQLIYDRAKSLDKLDVFDVLMPAQDWSTSNDGGARKVVREDQCIAGMGPKA
jgi:hypothetical protein